MHFGDAMQAFINKSRLKYGIQAHSLTDVWEQIMGKTVARYTQRLFIKNKTLFIETPIGPLRHELMYQRPQIMKRVNEHLGEGTIEEVVVQ